MRSLQFCKLNLNLLYFIHNFKSTLTSMNIGDDDGSTLENEVGLLKCSNWSTNHSHVMHGTKLLHSKNTCHEQSIVSFVAPPISNIPLTIEHFSLMSFL